MKVQLTLKYLKTNNSQVDKGTIKIGDNLKIQSAEQTAYNNVFYFMEKNKVQMESTLPTSISFDFLKDKHYIARKQLFCNQAFEKNELTLNSLNTLDKSTYTLSYELKIVQIRKNIDGTSSYIPVSKLNKKLTIEQEPQPQLDGKEKFQYVQLGKLTYLFAKMLDPLVKCANKLKLIFSWKMPQLTLAFGFILTLLVLFPKLSIIAISLCIFFGRNNIIKTVESSVLKYDISKRVLPPQENLQFLSDSMKLYCDTYKNITQFLQEDDRTKIITVVQVVCKGGVILTLLSIIFSLQTLLIIGIWTVLLLTTEPGKRLWYALWPQIVHYNRLADKVLKNVAKSSVGKALYSDGVIKIYKEFYIYQNQRWWLGKQWVSQYYSDQQKKQKLYARSEPPHGWKWIDNWHVQYTQNTDIDGFEYANDLARNYYTSSSALKTIRRRKWLRVCMKSSVLEQINLASHISEKQKATQKQNETKFYSPQKSSFKQKQI